MSLFYTQMVSLTRNFPSEVTARQRTCPLWPLLPSLALWQPRILPSFRPVSIFPANKLTVPETSFNFHFHNHSRGNEQGKNKGGVHKKRIYEEIPNPRERRRDSDCKRKEEIRKKKRKAMLHYGIKELKQVTSFESKERERGLWGRFLICS